MKIFLPLHIILFLSCSAEAKKENIRTHFSPAADTIPTALNDTTITNDTTLSIIAAGDIMFGTNFPSSSYLPPNDGRDLMQAFTEQIKSADIAFGNAEGVFLNEGGIPKGTGDNIYCFRQPVKYAQYFADNGFDLISVANNHVADFGEPGIKSTVATLQKLPLKFAGFTDYPTTIFEVIGKKIGMLAVAPHTGCVQMNNNPALEAMVKKLKDSCDLVIVSFHGGAEGKNALHVPKKTEIFFNQNRGNVFSFAHSMVDAGADIILGHGPHVARAMELYKGKLIAYSLGNFCTYGRFSLSGVSGIAPLLNLTVNVNGDFVSGKITSIKQLGEGGPIRDESNTAAKLIKNLSASDFPGNQLKIDEEGNLSK